MDILITTLLVLSVLLNVLLVIAGLRKVNQNDIMAKQMQELTDEIEYNKEKSQELLNMMREVDIRGSFESDDEVGAVFTQLKIMIEQYNSEL
jgi:uncharacterized membrane protein